MMQQHHAPYFHAEYAEFTAVIAIEGGDVLEGDLPRNKMKLVQAWLEIHRDEIMADWSLAVRGLPVQKIKPLE
ncbi:MAG: DUF4160 domain-containing protein [Chlorobium sp.]